MLSFSTKICSLVDPGIRMVVPRTDLIRFEPESDLVVGGFYGVGTVADVSTNIDAKITSNSTRL